MGVGVFAYEHTITVTIAVWVFSYKDTWINAGVGWQDGALFTRRRSVMYPQTQTSAHPMFLLHSRKNIHRYMKARGHHDDGALRTDFIAS